MKQIEKLAVDIGFGWTKYKSESEQGKFLSIYAPKPANYGNANYIVSVDNNDYVVGEGAEALFYRAIHHFDISDLINNSKIFIAYLTKQYKPKKIVSGLPPKFKNHFGKYKKSLQDFAEEIILVPQGAGILHHCVTAYNLHNTNNAILTIDVGYNTVDYIITHFNEQGSYVYDAYDSIIDAGVNKCTEFFLSLIEKENEKLNLRKQEVQKILEQGHYVFAGTHYDFSLQKQKATEFFSESLANVIALSIPQNLLKKVEKIIIGGGGAYYINKNLLPFDPIIPDNPEFAQVNGYFNIV